jgi:transcription-repair coupling factor (superfamily II helicase)
VPLPLPDGLLQSAEALSVARGAISHAKGAEGCAAAHVAARLKQAQKGLVVLIVPTHEEAVLTMDDLTLFAPGAITAYLPPFEASPYDATRPDRAITLARAATLSLLAKDRLDFLITTATGWIRRVPPRRVFEAGTLTLRVGEPLDFEAICRTLIDTGYARTPVVEDPATFAVRGDILDVWPPTSHVPLRLELDFESLASIAPYDPETQIAQKGAPLPEKTQGKDSRELCIPPARESIFDKAARARAASVMQSLCDAVSLPTKKARALIEDVSEGHLFIGAGAYLPACFDLESLAETLPHDARLIFHEPASILEEIEKEITRASEAASAAADIPHFSLEEHYVLGPALDRSLKNAAVLCLHKSAISGGDGDGFLALAKAPEECPHLAISSQEELSRRLESARKSGGRSAGLEPLCLQVKAWREEGMTVVFTARVETQAERLAQLLEHRGLTPGRTPVDLTRPRPSASLVVMTSDLGRGMVAPLERLVLLTEEEVFGRRHHTRRKPKAALAAVLDDLRSLSPGDFVVHVEHGIGRYLGLEHRTVGGHTVELLIIEYQGGDKLLLPVYRLNQVQKFSGEAAPRVDRLGGQTFAKTKATVKKKVRQIADRLLKLYAERKAIERPPIDPPGDEFFAFEAAFPHEETPDQAAAILDVIDDLKKETVMDRLVCGDVGFGKTEVALRAAFLAAHTGRQVALLCPTTVLAEQHLRTFSRRFADTGVTVRGLSRFQSKTEQDKTLAALKSGQVDIVIGTHRLLSGDVYFKNLGLLIVDEEQRFGVAHKERVKELRRTVDVLTLSATPIPRTLNLAVGGLRDMSVIATAPQERRSIRTITSRFDENVIQSAVRRELERGGQVYYVHNRVEGIYERTDLLRRLVPEARIVVGHGQMTERALEKAMLGFVAGEFDILCATSIVESGLDIPDANTIIIDRADLFGLSQLYQIRGRVGRSSSRAYCYLLVPSDEGLSQEARARISALERYTELGSGFHIATMDMEIRGAGELLGADQSGFTAKVGFELFSQMLEEAAADLRGEHYISEVDPDLSIDVEALLPETYIEDIGVRLSLYKRYALATSDDDIARLDEELKNRFGSPPGAAVRFSEMMRLKTQLRKLRALGLSASAKTATLHFREDTPLSADRLVPFIKASPGRYRLTPDGRLTRTGTSEENGLTHAGRLLRELGDLLEAPRKAKNA